MRMGAIFLCCVGSLVYVANAAVPPCLADLKLNQGELDVTYTRVLNQNFNLTYNSLASPAGKKLRALFDFLELDLNRHGDAAGVLQATFAHLYNDTSFVDRYYAGRPAAELAAMRETWITLEARV